MKSNRFLLVFLVLGALGPGIDWAEAVAASGPTSARHAPAHRTVPAGRREQQSPQKRRPGTARQQAQPLASKPTLGMRSNRGGAARATPTADSGAAHALAPAPLAMSKTPFAAGPPPGKQAITTPHFTPRYFPSGYRPPGLSGSAGRGGHSSAPVVIGGPARYDARNGAVIDGNAMRHKPL